MQLTFHRGTIIHAIDSNGLDVTLLFSNGNRKFPPAGRSRFLGLHAGLTEGFDGGEEACSAGSAAGGAVLFDLIVGGAVLDMALMPTREGVAVPEMLNGQCILLQLMHEGSNGKRGCTM